jgi:hypothetical protein
MPLCLLLSVDRFTPYLSAYFWYTSCSPSSCDSIAVSASLIGAMVVEITRIEGGDQYCWLVFRVHAETPCTLRTGTLSIWLAVNVTFGEVRVAPSSPLFTGFDSLASEKSSSSACYAIPPPRAFRPDQIDECSHGCYSRFPTHRATSEHATVVPNIRRSDTNSSGPWCALHQRHATCASF